MFEKLGLLPKQASSIAASIDHVYLFIGLITVVFTVLLYALIVLFAIKYRKKEGVKAVPIEGNHKLEVIWVGLPTIIVMIIFFWSTDVYFRVNAVPKDAMQFYGTGKQWMWKFQHPNGKREINDLHVPVGVPVKISLTSEDVIHSFYVPAFRVKMDVVPGKYTGTWFKADKPGVYHLFCAEYCGTKHSQMIGSVVALEPQEYQKWLNDGAEDMVTAEQRGKKVFFESRCNSCHVSDSSMLGPSLYGVFGSQVQLANGEIVTADENYIRQSIMFPNRAVVAGYSPVMPTYSTQLSEDQIIDLISYIKTLKSESQS